ncbi:UNVERIFIED_CONTAM: E3 ubiquitin-protein ligase SHPRH [Trichonephila clavipes]
MIFLNEDGTPLAQFPSSVLNLQTELKEKIGKQLYLKSLKKFENTDQPFDERCPVCFEDFEDLWSVLQCGHCICPICIHKLGESATTLCPVCRQNASFTDALYVDLNTKGIYSTKVYSVVRQLIKIKKEDSSAKSLVFSNKNLDLFKNSNINVLLLPLNEGINGLNLIEATHILLMEPALDNSKVLQAIGCVRRIGQTKKTMVHQFVLENTIEENIHNVYKENPLRSLGDFSVQNLIALCNHG